MKNKFAAFFAVLAIFDAGLLMFAGETFGAIIMAFATVFLAWAATQDV